ncbi:MAG: PEP-CTERM sorting domain-containing protein, partial [Planctomycetales bacterium]|nr:PEP-CTERM sorting domain-containing protein [Planctomycetales bacterium]
GIVDLDDHAHWVHELKHTWLGDANLDGEFNTADFVSAFSLGGYEQDTYAGWADGDWNGDERFGTSDLIAAFQDGGYENGPRAAVVAVPEPSTICLLSMAAFTAILQWRRRS